LHQAFGYNKFGNGQQIAIVDNGFYTTQTSSGSDHADLDSQSVATFGTFTEPSGSSHGTQVMAAAGGDGSGVFGVAPQASFHLTQNTNLSGYSDIYSKLAASADNASSAVVMNNSWGHDVNIQVLQAQKTQYSWSSAQAFNYNVSTTYSQNTSSIQAYIDALNDFQDHGVVVYALTNDDNFTDADMSAGMAVLFPELDEAFIAAANVNVQWDGNNLSYVLKSGPCGQAAIHCLSSDGWDITLGNQVSSGTSSWANTYGTSFVAPTISGAIALLAEHFPNQTPEQWTKRLFASADNNLGFTQTGSVTFGNGVVHGYSNEAGHGMLDIYAALQPITTSSSARNQIYAGSSSLGQSAFSLDSTRANLSRSFGDALEIGLENTNTYFYDALDGGFAVGMNDLAFSLNPVKPSLSVKSELSNLSSVSKKLLHFKDTGWSESSDDRKGFFNASVSSSPSALNNFYLNAGAADLGFAAYSMPTLSGIQGGDGFNLGLNMGEGFLTTSFTQTNISNNLENEVQSSFITSYQQEISKDLTYSLMFGLADEGSKFLGMTGGGAFDLEGSKSNTSLAGAKVRLGVGEMSSIGFMAAISKSELSEQNQGFITGIDNVTADTFALSFDTFNVFGNDKLSVSLSQPHRVNSGTMGMQIAGLADSDGNIPYTYHDIGLTPSGRQVDLSIGYSKDISENTTIGARFIHTKEAGHVKSAQDENSIFAGITYKNLNLGGSYVDVSNRVEAEINYTIRW
jgi:subtilase-type serine protease